MRCCVCVCVCVCREREGGEREREREGGRERERERDHALQVWDVTGAGVFGRGIVRVTWWAYQANRKRFYSFASSVSFITHGVFGRGIVRVTFV